MADIYRGSKISKVLGLGSFLLLLWSIPEALSGDWVGAGYAIFGSTLAAYGGYRAAGGRNNSELAKAYWEPRRRIDLVGDQVASWPAKVEAMFSLIEEESAGNYRAALQILKLRNTPQAVQTAYDEALQFPSKEAWNRLKQALLENPPPS